MYKKILLIALCGALLFGITGCGSNKTKYTENMEDMRNITIGYLENNHLGELLDKAIEDASWEEDENYSSTSGAIIVTGKDKNTKDSVELEDMVFRSYGILTNCRKISSEEAKELLSNIKLGVDLGILDNLDDSKVQKLYLYTKPANLQKYLGAKYDKVEQEIKRAEVIKQIVK